MSQHEQEQESAVEPSDLESEGSPSGLPASFDPVAPEQAAKQTELIRLWEEVDAFLQLTPAARPPRSPEMASPALEAARARFASLFDEEIQVVHAARNATAHARPVDESVFDEALELARELVKSIRQGEDLLGTPPTASASASD
jgi:hypothetical protein